MQVHQLLAAVTRGDAVSNQAFAMRDLLRRWGHKSEIYAEHVHSTLVGDCHSLAKWQGVRADLVIYHHSIGSPAADAFAAADSKRMVVYHNVTPPHFLAPYNPQARDLTLKGRSDLARLAKSTHFAIGDSSYNCQELAEFGFANPKVLPILFDPSDFERTEPDPAVLAKYRDGYVNFLFVGRLAPNKCQEDVIRAVAWYKRFIDRRSRLFLVGDWGGLDAYLEDLRSVARSCRIEDGVVFTGKVPFTQILAYYRLADVFLSMSEHEGFCVPLLEAMHVGVPIIAYSAAAVPETLGDGGILVNKKDFPLIAEAANLLVTDSAIRTRIIEKQRMRLSQFSHDRTAELFRVYVEEALAC